MLTSLPTRGKTDDPVHPEKVRILIEVLDKVLDDDLFPVAARCAAYTLREELAKQTPREHL